MKSNKYLDSLNSYEFSEEALARKVYKYENPRTGQIYEYNHRILCQRWRCAKTAAK